MSTASPRPFFRNPRAREFAEDQVHWYGLSRVRPAVLSPLTGVELSHSRDTPSRVSWALAQAFSLHDYSPTLLYVHDIVNLSENFMSAGDMAHWTLLVPKDQRTSTNSEIVFEGWQMRPLRAAIQAAMWFQWRFMLVPQTPLAVVCIDEDWRLHVGTSHDNSEDLLKALGDLAQSRLPAGRSTNTSNYLAQLWSQWGGANA